MASGSSAGNPSSSPDPPASARPGSPVRWRKKPAGSGTPPSIRACRGRSRNCASTHKRRLLALAKIEVLVLDDWALQTLEPYGREDLLEIMDDRAERHATVITITAQLPIEHRHGRIGDATIADAILDRLLHHAHRVTLKGESLRRATKEPKSHSDKTPNVTD